MCRPLSAFYIISLVMTLALVSIGRDSSYHSKPATGGCDDFTAVAVVPLLLFSLCDVFTFTYTFHVLRSF